MNGRVLPLDPAQVHIPGVLRAYEAGGNAVIFCGPAHFERRD
jgi:hypothetical protein